MENTRTLVHQVTQNLCEQSQKELAEHKLNKNGKIEISVLSGKKATNIQIAQSVKKLAVAFPNMKAEFFNLLAERINKSGMSAKRLEYAVNYVLDNFQYSHLNIADIMSLDVKCKVYSYKEMCTELSIGGENEFAPIFLGDAEKPYFVLKIDKLRYNLPDRIG